MKTGITYCCGHGGLVHSAAPLNDLERKRRAACPCPECRAKGWEPITRTPDAYAEDHPPQKRKIRKGKDDDVARDLAG